MTREEAILKLYKLIYCTIDRRMIDDICYEVIEFLEAQEPRVMTLEEVEQHYSLPPVFPDDFCKQEDYLNDIAPLYFDFKYGQNYSWVVHWRRYSDVAAHLNEFAEYYGKRLRCWTARPTDKQREAAPWE